MTKRLVVRAVGVATALLLGFATPAAAFECYNAVRSAQGNLSAAKSSALMSIEEILGDPEIVGLCPEHVEFVVAGLEDARLPYGCADQLPDAHGSWPRDAAPGEAARRVRIDHLSEDFFATVDPLIGEAFGTICGPPGEG